MCPSARKHLCTGRIYSEKQTETTWAIIVNATIEQGWHLYAKDDLANELNAVSISWENPAIKRFGRLESGGCEQTIHDAIFDILQNAFKGNVLLRQIIDDTSGVKTLQSPAK